MITRLYTRAISGTAALITLNTGFRPKHVRIFNPSTAGLLEWFEGMGKGTGMKIVTAGTQTYIATAGITVTDQGFSIGTDNTNAAPTVTTTMTGTKGTQSIVVASATGLLVDQYLVGTGLPTDTKITSISGTTIGIDKALTQDVSAQAVALANLMIFAC